MGGALSEQADEGRKTWASSLVHWQLLGVAVDSGNEHVPPHPVAERLRTDEKRYKSLAVMVGRSRQDYYCEVEMRRMSVPKLRDQKKQAHIVYTSLNSGRRHNQSSL